MLAHDYVTFVSDAATAEIRPSLTPCTFQCVCVLNIVLRRLPPAGKEALVFVLLRLQSVHTRRTVHIHVQYMRTWYRSGSLEWYSKGSFSLCDSTM